MKKNLLPICVAMLLAVGCGKGGSYTQNPILGTIPSICEQFYSNEKQSKDETEIELNELAEKGKLDKAFKLSAEKEAEWKENKVKFDAEYAAELLNIVGREVPISYNADLQNSPELFYTVSDAKIIDNNGTAAIAMTIKAKHDFTVGRMQGLDYSVCLNLMAADGKVLTATILLPIPHQLDAQTFTADQLISGPDRSHVRISMRNNAADYVNFSGIEFITHAQYKAAQK